MHFPNNEIFKLPGFGVTDGVDFSVCMPPINRGILIKQVWFTVNMGKKIQNIGQPLLTKLSVIE